MTLSPPNEGTVIIISPNVIAEEYCLSFGSSCTPAQGYQSLVVSDKAAESSQYWKMWAAIENIKHKFMSAEDVAEALPDTSEKTIRNWYTTRHRLPRKFDDLPHPDWKPTHFIESSSLPDDTYREFVAWMLAMYEEHLELPSANKIRKWKKGIDPYPELPNVVRFFVGSRDELIKEILERTPEDYQGHVSIEVNVK